MKDKTFSIELKCLFCGCELEGDTDTPPVSGELIECLSCHEMNDYDAVLEVAKEKGLELAKEHAKKEFEKSMKKIFKN